MGKPGKVPSKENLTSLWAFGICQTIYTKRDVKDHVFKYRPTSAIVAQYGGAVAILY